LGEVAAGDAIERVAGPAGGVTIGDLVEADREPTPDLLGRIVGSAEVPESWRTHAQRALQRHP
jgi:hypothetical protein